MGKKILLVKIGQIDKLILIKLKKNLEWAFKDFNCKVKISSNEISLKKLYFNPRKRKYDAHGIINQMNQHLLDFDFFRALGVINEDIYGGSYNFIFGCAESIPSKIALISTVRLNESFYSRIENQPLFEKRILREAIHELGHTFGLIHCDFNCVMQFSNSLMQADQKPISFCNKCYMKLELFFEKLI